VNAERQTVYRWGFVWGGAVLALLGAVLLGVAISLSGAWSHVSGFLGLSVMGWGPLLQTLNGLGLSAIRLPELPIPILRGTGFILPGALAWLGGWGLIAAGIRRAPASTEGASPASGAPLYPRLAQYRDFYWSTLCAYGGGILLAELVLILLQTFLSSGGGAGASGGKGLPPTGAFAVALIAASLVAFVAGSIGASRARRLSVPEATIGVIYLGLPRPGGADADGGSARAAAVAGLRLREVTYVAELLGRPAVGYWLVFTLLVLMLVLGINTGFIAAGSGRVDLKLRFELFVARRHVGCSAPRCCWARWRC
jgi:lipoprotein-releasing system permease protein